MREHGDLSTFTAADVESILSRELSNTFSRYSTSEHPSAILLTGQPGAGKTELSSMLVRSMNGNAVFLNGDDYRRYHPHYRELHEAFGADSISMTSPFSSAITEAMIDKLSERHFNLIIEGTGRTVEVPKATAELLVRKGYIVNLAAIAVRPEISLISILKRFYKMAESGTIPRATAIEAHDLVVACLPGNLDILNQCRDITNISIWDRELKKLYDSSSVSDLPSTVLKSYWNRPWNEEELSLALQETDQLFRLEAATNSGQLSSIQTLLHRLHAVQNRQSTANRLPED